MNKKHHKKLVATSIAALTNKNNVATAALTFVIGELDTDNTARVQLLPAGNFKAKDGRPYEVPSNQWLMDELAFGLIQDSAKDRENDFHFDYEHQTLNAEFNGKPAPAAGWWRAMEYIEGEGLFALDVAWSPKAKDFITNGEYRYVSAVFSYDAETGRVLTILHAALTNDPALDGMKAVEALKQQSKTNGNSANQPGEIQMNEALTLMLGLLGVAQEGEDLTNAVALKAAEERIKTAIAALKTKADKSGQLEKDLATAQASVVALKAKGGGEVDLAAYVPKAAYDATVTQLAALKAQQGEESIDQLIKDNKDKVLESEIQYMTDFGNQQGHAALKNMLEARPVMAALKSTQTKNKQKPAVKEGDLTAEQIAVCKNTGVTHAEFKAQLAEEGGE